MPEPLIGQEDLSTCRSRTGGDLFQIDSSVGQNIYTPRLPVDRIVDGKNAGLKCDSMQDQSALVGYYRFLPLIQTVFYNTQTSVVLYDLETFIKDNPCCDVVYQRLCGVISSMVLGSAYKRSLAVSGKE